MKLIYRSLGITAASMTLIVATGCDTTTGALSGAAVGGIMGGLVARHDPVAGALIGAAAGAVVGGIIGHLNEEQKAKLQQTSPQTLQTLQHNDQVAKQQAAAPAPTAAPATGAPAATPAATPAAAEDAPTPLKVDDIKAMAGAGIKPDAIIDAIKESKATYSAADIDAAQQATPPLDPSVIAFMKNPTA